MERNVTRKIAVRTEVTFAASHTLKGVPKCENLHGHNWRVEIVVAGKPEHLQGDGMLVEFSHLKAQVTKYDHKHLNDFIEIPTAENIAMQILDDITSFIMFASDILVTVWETEYSCAIASETVE